MPLPKINIKQILNNNFSQRIYAETLDKTFNFFYDYLNNIILKEIEKIQITNSFASTLEKDRNSFYRDDGTGNCLWDKININDFLPKSINIKKIIKPTINSLLIVNNAGKLDFLTPIDNKSGQVIRANNGNTPIFDLLNGECIIDGSIENKHIPNQSLDERFFHENSFLIPIKQKELNYRHFKNNSIDNIKFIRGSMKKVLNDTGFTPTLNRRNYFEYYSLLLPNNCINDIRMLCVSTKYRPSNKDIYKKFIFDEDKIEPPINNKKLVDGFQFSKSHYQKNMFYINQILPKTINANDFIKNNNQLSWVNLETGIGGEQWKFKATQLLGKKIVKKINLLWKWQQKINGN